jgi:hypothetical protein
MSDEPIYICNDCGRSNDGRQCVCGSDDLQIQARYNDYYLNDDPTNYSINELYEYNKQ